MTTIAESAERMEREAFEAWHRNFYRGGYSRSLAWGSFGYIDDTTQAQFVAWQAARRALPVAMALKGKAIVDRRALVDCLMLIDPPPMEFEGKTHVFVNPMAAQILTMLSAAVRRLTAPAAPKQETCWCQTCRPITMGDMRMVLCPTCGNKRCPMANDHRNVCTGSNEAGQPGSAYPKQEKA